MTIQFYFVGSIIVLWRFKFVLMNAYWYVEFNFKLQLFNKFSLPGLPIVFNGVHVTQSWVFCVVFFSLSLFSLLTIVVVCPYSIYSFWLPLWYLQSFLIWFLVLYIIVCPFVLFLLAIVLSVLLHFTASDYLKLESSNFS